MPSQPARGKRDSNQIGVLFVFLGFLVVFFAFGKGLVDLIVLPARTIDLAADDQIEAGFLPVYAEEGDQADPELVSVGPSLPQPFPTPGPNTQIFIPTPDPGAVPDRLVIPSIELETSVIPIGFEKMQFEGEFYDQWLAPDYRAAGWDETPPRLGGPGQTV